MDGTVEIAFRMHCIDDEGQRIPIIIYFLPRVLLCFYINNYINDLFLHGPEYDQIKLHSGANGLVVEKCRKADLT